MLNKIRNALQVRWATVERAENHLARLLKRAQISDRRENARAQHQQKLQLEYSKKVQAQLDLISRQIAMMGLHIERMENQYALSDPRYASPLRLERFGYRVHSQNDEDGIIAEIFRRIGVTTRTCVEIAAGDGKENCTAYLIQQGWRGIWVECDEKNAELIRQGWAEALAKKQLILKSEFITPQNVNGIINEPGFEEEIDLLIMDIDGNDYHVLEALERRPRVICTEFMSVGCPPPVRWIMDYTDKFIPWMGQAVGASLCSFDDLLSQRGYSLVGTTPMGVNAFFVRSDLVEGKFHAPYTPENHYNFCRYWYKNPAYSTPIWRGGESPFSANKG